MKRTSRVSAFWFYREGDKLIQCSKDVFDYAIRQGRSIWYGGYVNRKMEKVAEKLERSRMNFLSREDLPFKFRQIITDPAFVIEVEIIRVDDPLFWEKEYQKLKYC